MSLIIITVLWGSSSTQATVEFLAIILKLRFLSFAEFLTRQIRPLCCLALWRKVASTLKLLTRRCVALEWTKKKISRAPESQSSRRFFALLQLKETVEFPSPVRQNMSWKTLCQNSFKNKHLSDLIFKSIKCVN